MIIIPWLFRILGELLAYQKWFSNSNLAQLVKSKDDNQIKGIFQRHWKDIDNIFDQGATLNKGLPGGSVDKESFCNAGDLGVIPGWGRSPGEGNDNPLQYSCLENPMDRGVRWATVHGVTKSWTRLTEHAHAYILWRIHYDIWHN